MKMLKWQEFMQRKKKWTKWKSWSTACTGIFIIVEIVEYSLQKCKKSHNGLFCKVTDNGKLFF